MQKYLKLKSVSLLLVVLLIPVGQAEKMPDGYRYPSESDIRLDWEVYKEHYPEPYHVEADFNGDSIQDHVWILLSTENTSWGLFAFVSQNEDLLKQIKILEVRKAT